MHLTGLHPGTYTVTVYRRSWKKFHLPEDRKALIGNASFTVVQPQPGARYARSVQSECLGNEVPVSGVPAMEELSLSVFPNPANADVRVRMNLPRAEHTTLLLLDEQGNKMNAPLEFDAVPGLREFTFPISYFPHTGIFYCVVVTNRTLKMQAVSIIR